MKQLFAFVLLLGVALAGKAQTSKGTPVVIELFTSEGCSSCPPADRLLMTLDHEQPIAGAELIVLSEHVDYWNSLGWIDPYSSHEFSERQQRYASSLRVADPYTPQAVVDGRFEAVGNNAPKLEAAIRQALKEKKIPLDLKASRSDKGIHVELVASEDLARGAQIYFAIAEDAVQSKVSAGENGGRMLAHAAVVRSLTKTSNMTADLKTNARWGTHLRVVAFVADHEGGKIIGSAMVEL